MIRAKKSQVTVKNLEFSIAAINTILLNLCKSKRIRTPKKFDIMTCDWWIFSHII